MVGGDHIQAMLRKVPRVGFFLQFSGKARPKKAPPWIFFPNILRKRKGFSKWSLRCGAFFLSSNRANPKKSPTPRDFSRSLPDKYLCSTFFYTPRGAGLKKGMTHTDRLSITRATNLMRYPWMTAQSISPMNTSVSGTECSCSKTVKFYVKLDLKNGF